MNGRPVAIRLVFSLAALGACGCATYTDHVRNARVDFHAGNLDASLTQFEKLENNRNQEETVLALDRAMVELASGRPERAEELLRTARNDFEMNEQPDLAEMSISMLTDATRQAYAGEDYEKVLVRALLSLTSLVSGSGDALAYSLQTTEKQSEIISAALEDEEVENAELAYKQLALGPYLRAAIQESSFTNQDDVLKARLQVVSWEPDFRDGKTDLQRTENVRHSEQGNGIVYVFTLVGRGPIKEETAEIPTQAALLIADRIVSAATDRPLPPTIAPVKIGRVVQLPNRVRDVEVAVDGRAVGTTATLVDVGRMAVDQNRANYTRLIADAVARRVIKKSVIVASQEAVGGNDQPLAQIGLMFAGIVWEAVETCDTRCWSLLPERIQVLRLELPTGSHDLQLRPRDSYSPFGLTKMVSIEVIDGHNTFVLAQIPEDKVVGEILVSRQPNRNPPSPPRERVGKSSESFVPAGSASLRSAAIE